MVDDTLHTSSDPPHVNAFTPLPDVIKGKADWRDFRCIKLSNGVTVCLVHDKQAKTTAAAATVAAGASADPRELSGLAHFCEHMCFLGSKKFPGENDYKKYLSQHGGRSNASTSMHMTTYKFEILAPRAEKALDMFSQFFVEPLFTSSGTDRELNAVDSENSKNLTADGRRRLQILKTLVAKDHYYSKFSTGNAKTLPTSSRLEYVREALLAFHRLHYRPDNLTVVVGGPQSLDVLQEWIMPLSKMPLPTFPTAQAGMTEEEHLVNEGSKDAPPIRAGERVPEYDPPLIESSNLPWPFVYTVRPLKAMRKMVLMWPLPAVSHIPDQSPTSVLSHLLGHEGVGSPFALLQNKSWISGLSAGCRVAAPDFSLFQIDLSLTEDGENHWEEVVDVILQHCRLVQDIADTDPKQLRDVFEETVTLSKIFFDQQSPSGLYSTVPGLSQSIVRYGTKNCLSAGRMLNESRNSFPLEDVKRFISLLSPSNMIVERCSKAAWEEMETKDDIDRKTEPWYGIDFMVSKIDPATVKGWNGDPKSFVDASALVLPRPNRFIPRDLDLCDDLPEEARRGPRIDKPIDPPNLLVDDTVRGRLWHRLDDRYALPKAVVTVLVRNAAVNNTKKGNHWHPDTSATVHSSILASVFHDALAQETYDSYLAGLSWSLSLSQSGIKISCSGFSDRLPDLAMRIVEEFYSSGNFLQPNHVESAKDRMLRNLRTYFESRRADSHAMYYRDFLMASSGEGIEASIKAAESVTMDSIRAHHKKLLENQETETECFLTGNLSETNAKDFFGEASSMILSSRKEGKNKMWIPGTLERRIPPGSDYELHFSSENPQEENGAVLVTYQSPIPGYRGEGLSSEESLVSTASIRLLSSIIREPCFNELRTKQTLGYIVSSYYDVGFSSPPANLSDADFSSIPVNLLVVSVLSKKLPPPEVALRIDDFLKSFRETISQMPSSEIEEYATALSTKLLKPNQKLDNEANVHFGKILRYAPEIGSGDLPWKSIHNLAAAIRLLRQEDLVKTWDQLTHSTSRSRIVSHVYGSTFPLDPAQIRSTTRDKVVIVENMDKIKDVRMHLPVYDNKPTPRSATNAREKLRRLLENRRTLAVTAVVGAGVVGAAFFIRARSKKR